MGKKYRLNPWLEIQNMKEEIGRIMEEGTGQDRARCDRIANFKPVADVYAGVENYMIRVELPGLAPDAVSLEISSNTLAVCGERRLEKDASGGAYQILERSYGMFYREFVLPEDVLSEGITASMEQGVLSIRIPRIHSGPGGVRIELDAE